MSIILQRVADDGFKWGLFFILLLQRLKWKADFGMKLLKSLLKCVRSIDALLDKSSVF